MNRAQAIIAILRGEVDRVEVGAERLLILGEAGRDREAAARQLREQHDQRHPELVAAKARRRAAAAR